MTRRELRGTDASGGRIPFEWLNFSSVISVLYMLQSKKRKAGGEAGLFEI